MLGLRGRRQGGRGAAAGAHGGGLPLVRKGPSGRGGGGIGYGQN